MAATARPCRRRAPGASTSAANTLVSRSSPLLQRHDQRLIGDRVQGAYSGRLGSLEMDWAAGLDISSNTQTRFPLSLSSTVSIVDPIDFTTETFFSIPGMAPVFVPDRTNDVGTVAAFVENRTRLSSSFSLVTALRAERIELEGTNLRPATISPNQPGILQEHLHARHGAGRPRLQPHGRCQPVRAGQHRGRPAGRHPDHGELRAGA